MNQDILILASYGDVHAAAVSWALQCLGSRPSLWYGSEFPAKQTASICIDPSGERRLVVRDAQSEVARDRRFRTVWNRRPQSSRVPPGVHSADVDVVKTECDRMVAGLLLELAQEAFWVNQREKAVLANNKPRQLVLARAAGLTIPDTLFSNDPGEIRQFFKRHSGDVIYKAFHQPQWLRNGVTYSYFTSLLPAEAINDDYPLRTSPGIYQPRVEKAYEVRVTIIGEQVYAVSIDSQSNPQSKLDWRQDLLQICSLAPIQLPQSVLDSCRSLMAKLGLVFGCLDFIVTPANEYIFLEVNEMGQFLWIEERVPQLRLLEAFIGLLVHGRPDAPPLMSMGRDLSFAAFIASDHYVEFKRQSAGERPWQLHAVIES
jgi:glutathione synthase/RimK-type ligase-like ATP-grasp enzyme